MWTTSFPFTQGRDYSVSAYFIEYGVCRTEERLQMITAFNRNRVSTRTSEFTANSHESNGERQQVASNQ